ncbi:MAG TPA: hypothetical protein V6C98_16695, partial [Thermosynechococcaceae cyanobacterium]
MSSELLQQVRVIDPVSNTDRVTDVLIADGMVQAMGDAIADSSDATEVQDCRGLVLGTGLVDLYSHSGEPGFEERETLQSLLQAASAGGFTRIAILPDTKPAIDNPSSVAWVQGEVRGEGRERRAGGEHSHASYPTPDSRLPSPHLYCWGGLTLNVQGQQMTELSELAATEIVGFADGRSLTS